MYNEIFGEIIDIIHNDYAGCQDKKGWDRPNHYRELIINAEKKRQLTDESFVEMVQDYLLDLKDSHLSFRSTDTAAKLDVGFTVRRYKDQLYITSVEQEHRLHTGEAIVSLDGNSILNLAEKYKRKLMESPAEREKWNALLPEFQIADIADENGKTRSIDLRTYEKAIPNSEYTMDHLDDNTLILKMTDFLNADAISELVEENKGELAQRQNLIIDVRVNRGGSDASYFPLLPFLFARDIVNLSDDENAMLTNCTERNVDLRTQIFQDMLSGLKDQQTRNMIHIFIREMEKHRGEGFVELDLSELEDNMRIKTKPGPDKVIVLTDVYCGSSGDSFVEAVKESTKVTVVGRATAGLNDYANVAFKNWENRFELIYPTSRSAAIDQGNGMTGIGVKPNIYTLDS